AGRSGGRHAVPHYHKTAPSSDALFPTASSWEGRHAAGPDSSFSLPLVSQPAQPRGPPISTLPLGAKRHRFWRNALNGCRKSHAEFHRSEANSVSVPRHARVGVV